MVGYMIEIYVTNYSQSVGLTEKGKVLKQIDVLKIFVKF